MSGNQNEQQFIALYNAYVDEVYRTVYRRTGFERETAEDITQEVFLDVYRGLGRFRGLCSERTWVFRIAANKINDYYRRYYRQAVERVNLEDEAAAQVCDDTQDIAALVENALEGERILDCLNHLPPHYKQTLVLKYIEGRSIAEIAQLADKPYKAAESLLQRAKVAFMKQYKCMGEGESQK